MMFEHIIKIKSSVEVNETDNWLKSTANKLANIKNSTKSKTEIKRGREIQRELERKDKNTNNENMKKGSK